MCKGESKMSYQVRHYQLSSSRFRSAGFNSVSPPPLAKNSESPPAKKRKLCSKDRDLDPALWKLLPEDLFERVVAFLPFPGLFKCRAVNKHYKEFVFSERFLYSRASVNSWQLLDSRNQYLLLFATVNGVNMCTAYDSTSNRWLCMPPMQGLDPRAKDCIAGDGGLLCFRDVDAQGVSTLFVYNPVTSSCRELPAMHKGNHHSWLLTHMIYNRFTSSYKLLVLTKRTNGAHMEVYDSLTQQWTVDNKLSLIERKYKLSFAPQTGACCNNFFYFVAKERNNVMGIVMYDVYEGVFREKLLYRCEARGLRCRIEMQVVECKGNVHMVVREDDDESTKGVSLCTLNPSTEQKKEDAILFESFFHKWGCVFPNYRCVSVRDGLGLLLLDKDFHVLADDLSDELKLPPCPLQGLTSFVPGFKLFSSSMRAHNWPSYYASQNVVSEAHFQPNPSVTV